MKGIFDFKKILFKIIINKDYNKGIIIVLMKLENIKIKIYIVFVILIKIIYDLFLD